MPTNKQSESSSNLKDSTTSNNNSKKSSTPNSYQAEKNNQKKQTQDSNKKAAKVGAKAAATYFGGGAGGAAVDALSKTPQGDKILNRGGELLGKIPGMSKATKKLDDSGNLDKADQALSLKGGSLGENGAPTGLDSVSKSNDSSNFLSTMGNKSSKNKIGLTSSSKDESYDVSGEEEQEDETNFLGDVTGKGFLTKKKKILMILLCCFPFLIMCVVFLSTIGSADESEAESRHQDSSYLGNPDLKKSKGSKYESKWNHVEGMNQVGGACTYDIKGATNGQTSVRFNQQISNLKVRLMHSSFCGGVDNVPIEGESLVDFETYILGVVYGEISGGSNEAQAKTQAVAARSFILDRAIRGGNRSNGVVLKEENGQWILQVRNCVADQVFCNPDQGCSKKGAASNQYQDVFSGVNNKVTYKNAMPKNAKARQWVSETSGQILVDKKGYVVGTNYASSKQVEWRNLGSSLDYKQILLQSYGANKEIYTASCDEGTTSTGDFTSWKQYGASYSSIHLGKSSATIKSAGCLATSVAILIAKSKVPTTVSGTFDPGTFVKKMNATGGFDYRGNFQWSRVSQAAPSFTYQGNMEIMNQSRESKLQSIRSLLNQGYYVVAEVKGNTGQHWVAIDSVSKDTIHMLDPGSTSTNMWGKYHWRNTSRLGYFKAS